MKKVMFTAFALGLCLNANVMAQNNCNLINSITLSAQNTQSIENKVAVDYLTPSAINFQDTSIWHYVAVTKSNQNGKLFIDGSLVFTGTFAFSFAFSFSFSFSSFSLISFILFVFCASLINK